MNAEIDHITVCICTYKRQKLLGELLKRIQHQETEGLFTYSVVVVDNDVNQTAAAAVKSLSPGAKVKIDYFVEPVQNIALARNKAVENAKGEFLAFIDDDEFPDDDWLLKLYQASHTFKADGVLGPVMPHFEFVPPQWVVKGKLCERDSFLTGSYIKDPKYTRTGNVLLNRAIFDGDKNVFDPRFGRTGGEDVDFFSRMMQKGCVFVWCNEACVYEIVSPERVKRSVFLRRALLRGAVNSERVTLLSIDVIKSIIASVFYTSSLPFFLAVRHDLFMKYLIKDCDHLGKLFGLCGLKIKERTF